MNFKRLDEHTETRFFGSHQAWASCSRGAWRVGGYDSIRRRSRRFGFLILVVIPMLVLFRGSIGGAQENESLYSIQLGAFKDHGYAVDLVNSLKSLGHDAFERKERFGDNETIHRVYIERFRSRRAANQEAKSLIWGNFGSFIG